MSTEHWLKVPLSEIAEVRLGRQRSPKRAVGPNMRPYMRAANVTWEGISLHDVKEMDFSPEEFETYKLRPGDLLLAEASGSASEVGKPAVWTEQVPDCCFQNTLIRVRADADLVPFLHLHFYKDALTGEFARASRGVGIHHLGAKALSAWEVKLPPLGEQCRIVEIVDSYFTRLADAAATLERVQRNINRHRTAVIKAAVEGRLVPTEAELARAEGRDYEPASVLLERILAERRRRWEETEVVKMKARGKTPANDKWKAKYKEPIVPEESNLPAIPEGWLWVSLTQLFETITDGDHQPPPQAPDGIPFLVISNVKSGSVRQEGTRFVPQEYYDSLDEPRKPRSGDLLYTVTGSYGTPVRVVDDTPFCVQRHIAILRPTAYTNASFLYYVLQSRAVLEQADRAATGTAQKTVGLRSLREFVVPLPPGAEQDRIVASLEAQFSVADNTASVVRGSELRCARLRQAVLKWAFEGKLTDQDTSDEPAEAILKRISSGREAAINNSKGQRHRSWQARSTRA